MARSLRRQLRLLQAYVVCTLLILVVLAASSFMRQQTTRNMGEITAERINIVHISIHRLGPYSGIGKVGLDLIVETRDRPHALSVLELVRQHGFPAEETIASGPPIHHPGAVPL